MDEFPTFAPNPDILEVGELEIQHSISFDLIEDRLKSYLAIFYQKILDKLGPSIENVRPLEQQAAIRFRISYDKLLSQVVMCKMPTYNRRIEAQLKAQDVETVNHRHEDEINNQQPEEHTHQSSDAKSVQLLAQHSRTEKSPQQKQLKQLKPIDKTTKSKSKKSQSKQPETAVGISICHKQPQLRQTEYGSLDSQENETKMAIVGKEEPVLKMKDYNFMKQKLADSIAQVSNEQSKIQVNQVEEIVKDNVLEKLEKPEPKTHLIQLPSARETKAEVESSKKKNKTELQAQKQVVQELLYIRKMLQLKKLLSSKAILTSEEGQLMIKSQQVILRYSKFFIEEKLAQLFANYKPQESSEKLFIEMDACKYSKYKPKEPKLPTHEKHLELSVMRHLKRQEREEGYRKQRKQGLALQPDTAAGFLFTKDLDESSNSSMSLQPDLLEAKKQELIRNTILQKRMYQQYLNQAEQISESTGSISSSDRYDSIKRQKVQETVQDVIEFD